VLEDNAESLVSCTSSGGRRAAESMYTDGSRFSEPSAIQVRALIKALALVRARCRSNRQTILSSTSAGQLGSREAPLTIGGVRRRQGIFVPAAVAVALGACLLLLR
jgi:hypothetical protein